MYVKSLTIENVKSFTGAHTFNFANSLNFLVGDNNGGKSTVFESMLFLFEGPTRYKPEEFYTKNADGPTRVLVDLEGGVRSLVETDKFKKLEEYVFIDDDGDEVLRLERSSADRTVAQGGKQVTLDVKKLCFWNSAREQFENPTGIDALAKAIIDFEAIWADTSPNDYIDFAANKTLGRLLDSAAKQFFGTEQWSQFTTAHGNAFTGDGDSLVQHASSIATEIKTIVEQQYGKAEIRFDFTLPDAASFVKMGELLVDDGAGETPVAGKGTGMQRALALSVIQLYAKAEALADEASPKPLILLMDEPETWLHPNAQLRLADALCDIARREQIFIITHSPYLIRKFDAKDHQLAVFAGQGAERTVKYSTNMGMLGPGEPSWGEINYRAFGICSHEFHNELYGAIQAHLDSPLDEGRHTTEKDIDRYFVAQGVSQSKTWARSAALSYLSTLPVYVRNWIHHPENTLNAPPSDIEFQSSTEDLVRIVESLQVATPS